MNNDELISKNLRCEINDLRSEIKALRAENKALRAENEALKHSRELFILTLIDESEHLGWAMKNEDPFEDCVKEVCDITLRKLKEEL